LISASTQAAAAMTAGRRKINVKIPFDLVDPDVVYVGVTSNNNSPYSNLAQVYDKKMDAALIATCELGHWPLDGSALVMPRQDQDVQVAYMSDAASTVSGSLSNIYVQLNLANLGILQTASVFFSELEEDGAAVDFLFEVLQGNTVAHSEHITGNTETRVDFWGFTVYNVTGLRVTVTKWSRSYCRARVIEIIPGIYDTWDNKAVYSVYHKSERRYVEQPRQLPHR